MLLRLAACVAKFSLTGTLEWTDLTGGKPLLIQSLSVMVKPVQVNPGSVFIPRSIDDNLGLHVFCALLGTANACETTVVTNVVQVDQNSNSATLRTYTGKTLAIGCYDAIRIIISMYNASRYGSVAATQ